MTEPAAKPQAELTTGSILRLAPIAQARMIGSQAFVIWYQLSGLVIGLLIGQVLLGLMPIAVVIRGWLVPTFEIVDVARIMLAIIGWSLGLRLAHRLHQRKFLAGIQRRGTPESVVSTYFVTEDALHIVGPRMSYCIAWDAVLEIIPSPEGWLIQVDMITFQLPQRAFADPEGERAFLRSVLERSRAEVWDRSKEASVFAAGA